MSASIGRRATADQAHHLFVGVALGPQNLLHHDTVLGYGFTTSSTPTAGHSHDDDCAKARTKRKASNREHLRAFPFYFRTSEYCNSTPPIAYYKRGGRDPRQGTLEKMESVRQCPAMTTYRHTLKHTNAPTHRDLGTIPLSTKLVTPYYKHPGAGQYE
jgi:hypothetical protein